MGTAKDSEQTKTRLIEVSGVLFAEKGYADVTVREIIDRAKANLGALNYHFGSKEYLYGAVLTHACAIDAIDIAPLAGLSAHEKLKLIILNTLETCSQPIEDNWPYMLIKRESQFPSHLFDQLVEDHFKMQSEVVTQIIAEIVGTSNTAPEVEMGLVTMVGLLDMFGLNKHLIHSVLPDLKPYISDLNALSGRLSSMVIASTEHA